MNDGTWGIHNRMEKMPSFMVELKIAIDRRVPGSRVPSESGSSGSSTKTAQHSIYDAVGVKGCWENVGAVDVVAVFGAEVVASPPPSTAVRRDEMNEVYGQRSTMSPESPISQPLVKETVLPQLGSSLGCAGHGDHGLLSSLSGLWETLWKRQPNPTRHQKRLNSRTTPRTMTTSRSTSWSGQAPSRSGKELVK